MKTQTIYIAVSAGAQSVSRFKTRELADAQALLWNDAFPNISDTAPWTVIEVELPVVESDLRIVA